MLKARILTAAVLIPLTLGALFWLSPRGWGIFTLAIVGGAAVEWADLAGYRKTMWLLFVVGTVLIGLELLFIPGSGFESKGGGRGNDAVRCGADTLFWLLLAPAWPRRCGEGSRRARAESRLDSHDSRRGGGGADPGPLARVAARLMAVVWIADSAAYFSGRAFGKRKLAPTISPGKTWEGVYGALLATGLYALALLWLGPEAGYTRAQSLGALAGWLALVLALTALSIVGDLFESQLKRQRGVKNSGRILPGTAPSRRIDALLAAMPAAPLSHSRVR